MRTDNGYLRRSLVEVVYPGARYATLPAVAPWSWALRPCCLSSCAAQGSSRLSGANGGPTRSGPAVVGDSMANIVGSRWMSSSSSSVSGLVNALLRVTLALRDGGDRVVATSSEPHADVECGASVSLSIRGSDGVVLDGSTHDVTPALFQDVLPRRTFRWHYGQRHYSGSYWASTTSAHVIYESRLELARLLVADFDRTVNHIVAQPFMMRTPLGGRICRHIPDYLLLTEDGPVVVDVKPADLHDDPVVAETFGLVRNVVESVGGSFEVASEQPRVMMENVRFLAGFRRRAWVNESALRDLRMQKLDGASVGEVLHATQSAGPLARAALLHLLWAQELRTDLSTVLSSRSILLQTSSS